LGRPADWPGEAEPPSKPSSPVSCSGRRAPRRRANPAPTPAAQLILSRKGMDSGAGGSPSPILPDGTLLPLPIPDRRSPIRYKDIWLRGHNLGAVAEALTRGRVKASAGAHLDPDLDAEALSRARGWRPIFGTAGAAQKVLANCEVGEGDVFLYFGWFRQTELAEGGLRYVRGATDLHVLYGWLQVGEVVAIADGSEVPWAASHPHVAVPDRRNNTAYVAASKLVLDGERTGLPGAGSFRAFRPELQLTAPGSSRSIWRLPAWFYPSRGKSPLGYHTDRSRWSRRDGAALLRSAYRGQEFVLPMADYPEAPGWLRSRIAIGARPTARRRQRVREHHGE
jgi:hypothetical protein